MKTRAFAISCVVLFIALGVIPIAAGAPGATPKASPAAKAVSSLFLTGFETEMEDQFGKAHGDASVIGFLFDTDIFHSGKRSLIIMSAQGGDYCSISYKLSKGKTDWSAYKNLVIWVYGDNAGIDLNVYLEEEKGELFTYKLKDDFEGWKKFNMPFALFKSRVDSQPEGAVVDSALQLNAIKSIQFETGEGNSNLYYDDFSLLK